MDKIFSSLSKLTVVGYSITERREVWRKWKRSFEICLSAAQHLIWDSTQKRNLLLAHGGEELQEIFFNIPNADVHDQPEQQIDTYKVAIEKLDEYFAPKRHDTHERYLFWSMSMEPGETIEKFVMRAQVRANMCNFGKSQVESKEVAVIDKVMQLCPGKLREKLLQQEDLTLDKVIKLTNSYQATKTADEAMVQRLPMGQIQKPIENVQRIGLNKSACRACNYNHPPQRCPALGKTCGQCGKLNHFRAVCRTSQNQWVNRNSNSGQSTFGVKRSAPNTFDQRDHSDVKRVRSGLSNRKLHKIMEEENDDGYEINLEQINMISCESPDEHITAVVGGVEIKMEIDSGAQSNIIDSHTWAYMNRKDVEIQNFAKSDKKFKAYAAKSELVTCGMFDAVIVVGSGVDQVKSQARFYIVKNGPQPLLGKKTAIELGVLKISIPGSPANLNQIKVMEQFPKLKNVLVKLQIDETVTPVAQSLRRIPLALLDMVNEKLDELLSTGVISPVDGPRDWVSPIVPVLKDNGALRICIDMRMPNRAIKREPYPMWTIEDLRLKVVGAKKFSKLDCKDAYTQCELDSESKKMTAFITHRGIFESNRLMYGINAAPEKYQKILAQILAPCQNAINWLDDILIFGSNDEEHDKAVKQVLGILEARNVLLNHAKCVYGVTEIEFIGHIFDQNGIRPTKDRIQDLLELEPPKNAVDLKSFLGMVGYIGQFIPNLATVTAPLRKLTKFGVKFVWDEAATNAFNELKKKIAATTTLNHFVRELPTRLVADASPVGLGAVLLQFHDNEPKVVAYASRSLSETEKRYHQSEKESLALVFACEKFMFYLLGIEFELETDHKALETLFRPDSKPCLRIERWVLRLQPFRFNIVYRKGVNNIADPFSRLLPPAKVPDYDPDSEVYVQSIAQLTAIDIPEVEKFTVMDPELQELKECLLKDQWNYSLELLKPYHAFRNEFGSIRNLIVRRDRVVIPKALRPRLLQLAHLGHPGQTAMTQRLRYTTWWPGMDNEIKQYVKNCRGCNLVSQLDPPEPMRRKKLPEKPWADVAMDFLGPIHGGINILVVVDYYSRWIEYKIMTTITTKKLIEELVEIFKEKGLPESITLDNGPQFASEVFDNWCQERKITLHRTTPLFPQENGEVERQNRSIMKRIRISHELGLDWKEDLQHYVNMYHTTPHSTTGKTPSELSQGRLIRTVIPSLKHYTVRPPMEDFMDRDIEKKQKGKEVEDAKRNAKECDLAVGDQVWIRNSNPAKVNATFKPLEATVMDRSGSRVRVQMNKSGAQYIRKTTHLKKIPAADSEIENGKSCGVPADLPSWEDTDTDQQNGNDQRINNNTSEEPVIVNQRPKRMVKQPAYLKDHLLD